MGMGTEFKAASGRKVSVGPDGSVMFGQALGYLTREAAFDAEEYMQAKHDEELGRWRWPINPHIVVYPRHERGTSGRRRALVIDERAGKAELGIEGYSSNAASFAYFEAHPEPKPWHDAKAGEFWSVHHVGIETCRVDDVNGVLRFVGVDGRGLSVSMPITHHSITAAVRMVAEVAA